MAEKIRVGMYGLSDDIHKDLVSDMVSRLGSDELKRFKFENTEECLCRLEKGLACEVIIAHPHYKGLNGCWPRIRELAEKNPEKMFYVFAICAEEREDFFKKVKNLICLNGSVYEDFYNDPLKYLIKNPSQ